jgi:N-glycosylase/DNA lyase
MSFICSQNNNIKRITQLVRTFRNNFGEPICKVKIPAGAVKSDEETELVEETVYSFPSIDNIVENVSQQRLRDLGFGYRALYIVVSAKHIQTKGGNEWLLGMR